MIKLKRLLMEQNVPGLNKDKADASKKNKSVNWEDQKYVLKTREGLTKTVPLGKIFSAFGIENIPGLIGPNGHLTRKGRDKIKSRSEVSDNKDPIVKITSQASIDAKANVLKTYKDNPIPSAMEEQWTDEDKYNYNTNVWDKMKEYSEALQTWWKGVTTENSEANRLFTRKGVQGYYVWDDDDEELARDLWWESSTTGLQLYKKLEKLKKTETELLTKLSSAPELRPESQVQKIMNAMRNEYDSRFGSGDEREDSIYEEIIEFFNNDVEWDIQHPILVSEYEKYLVEPEIDTE